jgi:hypothetical protein
MIKNLKSGEVDLIVALTEGLVADISGGSDLKIVGTYVNSPLCWALSAGAAAHHINDIEDLRGKTFGISRPYSGSHLMAYVLARQRGWSTRSEDLSFVTIGGFKELRDSVNRNQGVPGSDVFMWETFTTKPFHDSGEVKRVGDITTPWPCFMVAGREHVIGGKLEAIRSALAAVHEAAELFRQKPEEMIAQVSAKYDIDIEDVKSWYSTVDISAHRHVSESALYRTLEVLCDVGVLSNTTVMEPDGLIDRRLAVLQNDIKKVKLYRSTRSTLSLFHNRVRASGKSKGKITEDDIAKFDQHHYGGIKGVDRAIDLCNISKEARVLNIGSGLGGPARYMAHKTGCQVLACELQNDLHESAVEVTERTGNLSRYSGF